MKINLNNLIIAAAFGAVGIFVPTIASIVIDRKKEEKHKIEEEKIKEESIRKEKEVKEFQANITHTYADLINIESLTKLIHEATESLTDEEQVALIEYGLECRANILNSKSESELFCAIDKYKSFEKFISDPSLIKSYAKFNIELKHKAEKKEEERRIRDEKNAEQAREIEKINLEHNNKMEEFKAVKSYEFGKFDRELESRERTASIIGSAAKMIFGGIN